MKGLRGERKRKDDTSRSKARAQSTHTLSRRAAGPAPEFGAFYGFVPQGIGLRPADSHPSTALPTRNHHTSLDVDAFIGFGNGSAFEMT